MAPKTAQGRNAAIAALKARRFRNKGRQPFDNSTLPAGSPMYFPCESCDDDIRHSESYLTRIKLCSECTSLKALGWLTE